MNNVKAWLSSNKLSLNIAKTEYILIGSRPKISSTDVQPTVKIDTPPIKRVKCTKLLGVEIDEHLKWEKHVDHIASKVSSGIGTIKKLKEFVDRDTLVLVYNALIQPHFDYCYEVWDELDKGLIERLQKLQNRACSNNFVSSAKVAIVDEHTASGRSLTYKRKKIGPRIDP